MNKTTINAVMVILTIGILLLPIGVSSYVEERTSTNIITVQGNYASGDSIGVYDGSSNVSELCEQIPFTQDIPLGWDADNDTMFYGVKATGTYPRDGEYYGNYITYTGGGVHSMAIDWTDVPVGTYDGNRWIIIPTNYTAGDLVDYDFCRYETTMNDANDMYFAIAFEGSSTIQYLSPTVIDEGIIVYTIPSYVKTEMDANPTSQMFIMIEVGDDADETQASFEWTFDAMVLDPEDTAFGSEYTDTAIWLGTMMALICIYTVAVIFATPWIDIDYDW